MTKFHEFQYSGVIYPDSESYYDAIAKDWLSDMTEVDIRSQFAATGDMFIAQWCAEEWEIEDVNMMALGSAFGRLRARYEANIDMKVAERNNGRP